MADNQPVQDNKMPEGENTAPQAGMVAQYIKDLSFENPNAPASLQLFSRQAPKIDVNVNIGVRQAQQDAFEVDLKIKVTGSGATPTGSDMVAFVCELSYAGLFAVRNLSAEATRAFMLVAAPTLMFPFARRVIADACRDGGFPPLMLEPINFEALYRQKLAEEQANGAAAPMGTQSDAPENTENTAHTNGAAPADTSNLN